MTNDYSGDERRRQAWHLDRKVPIALFIMLLSQFGTTVWWAAEVSGSLKSNAQSVAETARRVSDLESRERDSNKLVERIVRVETMLESVQATVNRTYDAVDPRRKK